METPGVPTPVESRQGRLLPHRNLTPTQQQVQVLECGEATKLACTTLIGLSLLAISVFQTSFGPCLNHIPAQFLSIRLNMLIVTTLILSTLYNVTHNAVLLTVYVKIKARRAHMPLQLPTPLTNMFNFII